MSSILLHLNYLLILLVAVLGWFVGALWYSVLFGRLWMAEMKMTPDDFKTKGAGAPLFVKSFLLTIASTIALAVLIVGLGRTDFLHGATLGAFVGVGLVATRAATNAVYEFRTLRHYLVVTGHDVVLLTIQGALLTHWH